MIRAKSNGHSYKIVICRKLRDYGIWREACLVDRRLFMAVPTNVNTVVSNQSWITHLVFDLFLTA